MPSGEQILPPDLRQVQDGAQNDRRRDEFRLLPGHGPETSVGRERRMSPFLADLDVWRGSRSHRGGAHGPFDFAQGRQVQDGAQNDSRRDVSRLLPGHGPETTVGRERRMNPFLADLDEP